VDGLKLNRDLLKAVLRSAQYRIMEATRPSEALAILDTEKVDLVILDLMMPEMSGPEFCRQLKANRRTQLIPLLILTSIQGVENEITGLASGADEFLIKPLHPAVVRTRIRAMLRNKMAIDSLEEAETILFALAQSVEQRDKYTGGHCQRLAMYSVSLGEMLGLNPQQLKALQCGGYLHDIGKICVPDSVLYHNGPLSDEQWEVMRSHTIIGEDICRPMKSLGLVLPIIRNHHERWDGTGYPDKLKGEEIPLLARVLQLADIYDALTTARPYKAALSDEKALEIIEDEARRGWRDPELVLLFRELCRNRFQGTLAGEMLYGSQPQITASLENMRRNLLK
jgi:putative two-component system response regulator